MVRLIEIPDFYIYEMVSNCVFEKPLTILLLYSDLLSRDNGRKELPLILSINEESIVIKVIYMLKFRLIMAVHI